MTVDYRVPVCRKQARVWFTAGEEHEITIFLPPDDGPESLLESDRRFFPAQKDDHFMIIARDAVAALWLTADPPQESQEDELPIESRSIRVFLSQERTISGQIRFVSSGHHDRTADLLNEPCRCFTVHSDESIVYIAKDNILYVQEE